MPKQFSTTHIEGVKFNLFYFCEKLTAWMQERKSLTSYSPTYIILTAFACVYTHKFAPFCSLSEKNLPLLNILMTKLRKLQIERRAKEEAKKLF